MKLIINENYYIIKSERNFIPCFTEMREVVNKETGKKEMKQYVQELGYHANVESALVQYARHSTDRQFDGKLATIQEYIDSLLNTVREMNAMVKK